MYDKNRNKRSKKRIEAFRKGNSDQKARRRQERRDYPEYTGVVRMTREGYAFIIVEGLDDDIFVGAGKTRGALNGDIVKVGVIRQRNDGKRTEGEIREIIERSAKPFVGVLHIVGQQAWVLMQSKVMPYDISIDILDKNGKPVYKKKGSNKTDFQDSRNGALKLIGNGEYSVNEVFETVEGERKELTAHSGMKVAAIVDAWPKGDPNPSGHLVDVLGELGENDTEMHAILAEYGLPYRFEPEVENAADSISEKITEKDIKERRDFRDTLTFTIDPADAKDFDDALSYKKLENGNFEVGVHIADVSYYVTPGSVVDKEAQARGTSVYLVDRTVPMLPEKLSNKLCSLRPNEEKLTFSAVFETDASGKVLSSWFGRTIIKSDYRFAYETAQQIIDNGEESYKMELRGGTDGIHSAVKEPTLVSDGSEEMPKGDAAMGGGAFEGCIIPKELKEAVLNLWAIAKSLRDKRFKSGAISFERPEMKVEVDEKGRPVNIYQKITKEANWLIEEFMLLANRSVAELIATAGKMNGKDAKNAKTFVYRIHDEPNTQKLYGLREFAGNFGYHTELGDGDRKTTAKELNNLLSSAKDKPEFMAIEMLALRSMAKACYSTDNIGHYGLAFKYYTHFTSPIRRYPDTMVHRLLSMYLDNAESQNKDYYSAQCSYASEREIIAANAERDSIKYKLVEYMQDKIGGEYDGRISGLTEWGMYVEVEPTKIEGMVALRDIKSDFFEFDEKTYKIQGRRSGIIYRLGDPVKIRVKATNLEQRMLDYELVETGLEERAGKQSNEQKAPGSNKEKRKAKIKAAIKASKTKRMNSKKNNHD